jgi:signal transduction histidine kinase
MFPSLKQSLSARLLVLTVAFVMVAEILIYAPSIARFRLEVLRYRLVSGHLAGLAVEAAPQGSVAQELETELLEQVGAYSIEVTKPGGRVLTLTAPHVPAVAESYEVTEAGSPEPIRDAFATLFRSGDRVIRAIGPSPRDAEIQVAVVIEEGPLREAMRRYSVRILALSIAISLMTATLVFLALDRLMVRPIRRFTEALVAFRRDPEDESASAMLAGERTDEVGVAQRELVAMQTAVRQALRQRERLAALGTAVTKINHDLRGILSTAVLISERLLESADPEVRRIGPRLLASIERAAALCGQTLAFTRDGVLPLRLERFAPFDLLEEVGAEILEAHAHEPETTRIEWINTVPPDAHIVADREQLFRAIANLARNAVEAAATRLEFTLTEEGDRSTLVISDNGGGLAPRARENLFMAFSATTKANGAGLGLAIAREVLRAHGGDIRLVQTGAEGTSFALSLPADTAVSPAASPVAAGRAAAIKIDHRRHERA